MEKTAFFYLLPVPFEEGQLLKPVLKLREQPVDAGGAEVLLEEAAEVEALLVEDEVHQGERLQHILTPSRQAAQTELQELALADHLPQH
jgi:hypothetical protein